MSKKTEQEEWWLEHGGKEWHAEMENRKGKPHYKNQICLINKVFQEVLIGFDKPRVLEVGCGYGRILSHLQKGFKHIKAFGCDQSEKMLSEAEDLGISKDRLFESNVRYPFSDMPEFDVVYTCEMLIHINPDGIKGAIKNIIGGSKEYVVHIENGLLEYKDDFIKSSDEHDGCWKHNFMKIYNELGYTPEVREQEGTEHTAYIIKVCNNT